MESNLFKWKHYESNIIILCVRWYLKYGLSFRDLADMMQERGLSTHAKGIPEGYDIFFVSSRHVECCCLLERISSVENKGV